MKPASTQNRIDLTVTPISPSERLPLSGAILPSTDKDTPVTVQEVSDTRLLPVQEPVSFGDKVSCDQASLRFLYSQGQPWAPDPPVLHFKCWDSGRILPYQAFLFDFTIKSSVVLSRLLSPLLAQNRTLKKKNASCKSYSISEQLPYFFVSNVLRPKPFNYFLTLKIDEN